jgi:hypothetical protein
MRSSEKLKAKSSLSIILLLFVILFCPYAVRAKYPTVDSTDAKTSAYASIHAAVPCAARDTVYLVQALSTQWCIVKSETGPGPDCCSTGGHP